MKKSIKRIKTKSNKNLKHKSRTRKQKKTARKTRKMRGGMTTLEYILADKRLKNMFEELVDARKNQNANTNDAQDSLSDQCQITIDTVSKELGQKTGLDSREVMNLVNQYIENENENADLAESVFTTPNPKRKLEEPNAPNKKRRHEDTQQELGAEDYTNIDDNFADRILGNYNNTSTSS